MMSKLDEMGGASAFKNTVELDKRSLELLAKDFAVLDELSEGIAARTLQHLLDGEGEQVLIELATLSKGADKFRLCFTEAYCFGERGVTPRRLFFKSVNCSDPKFFIRLGRAYEAISRTATHRHVGHLGDPRLGWLELLLAEATGLTWMSWPRSCKACHALPATFIEEMLKAEGHAPDLLVRAAFLPQLQGHGARFFEPVFVHLDGFDQTAVRHKAAVREALNHQDFKQRLYGLSLLKLCEVPASEFLEDLVVLALSSSKQVREQAQGLLASVKPGATPLMEAKAAGGENEERAEAARILWRWDKEKARAFFGARLEQEKNKKVLGVLRELLDSESPAKGIETPSELTLPPLTPVPERVPLGPETEQAWEECFQKVNAAIGQFLAGKRTGFYSSHIAVLPVDSVRNGFKMLQGEAEVEPVFGDAGFFSMHMMESYAPFWQRPELALVHLVRFFLEVGAIRPDEDVRDRFLGYGSWLERLLPVYFSTHAQVGLRDLAAAFGAAGLEPRRVGRAILEDYRDPAPPLGIPPAQIWPYWAENLDLLENAFAGASGDFMDRYRQRNRRRNAFHALATFPKPPSRLVPLLWDFALGPKGERPQAQRCLEGLLDEFERLVTSLNSGASETRLAAAEWLGRLGDKRAVEVLLAAFEKEKNEPAKGAMMSALEQLGVPLDQFLNRGALLKEAEKGIAKGVPEGLKWFPFDQLPAAHWADTGKRVSPVILQWWLAQGFKLKSPEPGALLRRYCASLRPDEREALGQFVLEAWVTQDLTPYTGPAAEQLAKQRAQDALHMAQYWAQSAQQHAAQAQILQMPWPLKTLEEYYDQFLPQVLREPCGSAIASKGILSLAGACTGAGAAPTVNRYLKDWYGRRVAQCRALLQMLSWVEHRTATQLLLAVSGRFRTKGIQEEATQQAQALAERKGWTVAELADRTIPSAGLDEAGVLTLDYGPRQFTGRLNENLEFVLTDSDGKAIKSLPEPRKDDDAEKAAEAKKLLSAAKKELKSVLTMQRERLYEAMCTQRAWPFEEWRLYLGQHPVVRHYCQRLIWAVVREDNVALLFRPLPDGSLTDAADEAVLLKPEELVRVAHECLVTPEQSQAWRQHLTDYEVEPLFEQFGRTKFALPEERQQDTELGDFEGHLVEAYKLRSRANKLGYTRGQAQDAGFFYDYHKRFPTLGIEAVIGFTGNALPEENRTVALTKLSFNHIAAEEGAAFGQANMTLSEVPAVLLSECWNDMRQIAAEGPGFDPDWEKKTEY